MVEINNQPGRFSIYWRGRRELITDVRKPKSWLWRHCRRAICSYSITLCQTCLPSAQNSNQQAAGRYQLLSVGGMPTASSLAWKTSLWKVRTLWHCSRLGKAWRFTYDWSWWYPSGNRPLQQPSGLHCRALVNGQFEHKADSLIAKFKEAGGTVRDWCMSRVTAIISALVICIIVCLSGLSVPLITPYLQSPSATKMPEQAGERQLWHADASAWWKRCARCKIHEGVVALMLKKLKWCSAWWCCRWSSSVAHQSSLRSQCIEATTASGIDNATSPRLADTAERDYFTLEKADHYAKTTGRNPSILMSSADKSCPYRWSAHAIIVSNTRASSGV